MASDAEGGQKTCKQEVMGASGFAKDKYRSFDSSAQADSLRIIIQFFCNLEVLRCAAGGHGFAHLGFGVGGPISAVELEED